MDMTQEELNYKINEMQQKLNAVQHEAVELLALVKAGNRLGLEEKAKNLLAAKFIAQRQLDRLSKALSATVGTNESAMQFVEGHDALAEEVAELLIESYGNMLREFSTAVLATPFICGPGEAVQKQQKTVTVTSGEQVEKVVHARVEMGGSTITLERPKSEDYQPQAKNGSTEQTEDGDTEPVTFGAGADLSALSRFIGN